MNVRRLVGLAVATALLAAPVTATGTAWAEPDYPPVFNQISASSFVVARYGAITFRAQTFTPGSAVNYRVTAAMGQAASGSAVADSKGVVTQSVTFTELGVNRVMFSGEASEGGPLELVTTVTVTDATNAGGSGTPGGSSGWSNGGGSNGSGNSGGGTVGSDVAGGAGGTAGGSGATSGENGGSGGSADAAGGSSGIPIINGSLPRTSGQIASTLLVAGVLLAGCAALFVVRRRRRLT